MAMPSAVRLLRHTWQIVQASMAAGTSRPGYRPDVVTLHPLWQADLTFNVRTDNLDWLLWEAWISDRHSGFRADDIKPYRDRMVFEKSSGNPSVTVASAISEGATSVSLSGSASSFVVGKFFWINSQMLQVISRSGQTVVFQPPLRADASAGTSVLGNSTIQMRLIDDDQGKLQRTLDSIVPVKVVMLETF